MVATVIVNGLDAFRIQGPGRRAREQCHADADQADDERPRADAKGPRVAESPQHAVQSPASPGDPAAETGHLGAVHRPQFETAVAGDRKDRGIIVRIVIIVTSFGGRGRSPRCR